MSTGPEKYKIDKFLERTPDPPLRSPSLFFFDSLGKCHVQLWSSV